MEAWGDLLLGLGVLIMAVAFIASVARGLLWLDPEWEAKDRPNNQDWSEHFARQLARFSFPKGKTGRLLDLSFRLATLFLVTGGAFRLIEFLLR